MRPRERARVALSGGRPPGLAPHLELEFQLAREMFGREALRAEHLEGVGEPRRSDLLKRNAELWVRIAQRFDWSVITGLHWLEAEDQLRSFEYVRSLAGDTYMLSGFCDGTWGIPSGADMTEVAAFLYERRQEAREQAQCQVEQAIPRGLQLIRGGAEVIFMCADYCFNAGPFLSPRMFAEFVTPFLAQQVRAWQAAGAFCVKHTDGNIMPVLDQLVGTGIAGLHSLDPMAGVDIRQVRRLVGPRLCLLGNVSCQCVQQGPAEKIEESARYCLEHGGVEQGAYIFCTSNCIFRGVPPENYLRMLEVRGSFGTGVR